MAGVTRWFWVRHAPVSAFAGRIYGRRDIAVDLHDREALRAVAARLPPNARWLTSPLKRARDTADALRAVMGPVRAGRPLEVEDRLIEQDFGAWEGDTHARLASEEAETHRAFWRRPARARPPGGESFVDVVARVNGFLDRFAAAEEDDPEGDSGAESIVVVTHAGPVRAALVRALALDPERALAFALSPLSITVIDDIATNDGRHHARVVMVNHLAAHTGAGGHG